MEKSKNFVFIINGHNGAGKDEFVNQFIQACENGGSYYIVNNISTIDPIKEMITIPNLWDGYTKDNASRQLMHDIKEAVDKYNGYTTKYVVNKTLQFIDKSTSLVESNGITYTNRRDPDVRTVTFIHCREPEKIKAIYASFTNVCEISVDTILVRRDLGDVASNAADQNVENFAYDHYISNNGTLSDLYIHALALRDECDVYSGLSNAPAYKPSPKFRVN